MYTRDYMYSYTRDYIYTYLYIYTITYTLRAAYLIEIYSWLNRT